MPLVKVVLVLFLPASLLFSSAYPSVVCSLLPVSTFGGDGGLH
jgi:hypothetical protein